MMQNILRSVKYFLHLCVLCVAVIFAMHFAGLLAVPLPELPALLFSSWRGWVLVTAVVVLSAAYPFTGFITRRVEGDIDEDRERIVNAFRNEGFTLVSQDDEGLTFRAVSPLRRLWLHLDDEVRVAQFGQWIELAGQRRTVARVAPRLAAYVAAGARDRD